MSNVGNEFVILQRYISEQLEGKRFSVTTFIRFHKPLCLLAGLQTTAQFQTKTFKSKFTFDEYFNVLMLPPGPDQCGNMINDKTADPYRNPRASTTILLSSIWHKQLTWALLG